MRTQTRARYALLFVFAYGPGAECRVRCCCRGRIVDGAGPFATLQRRHCRYLCGCACIVVAVVSLMALGHPRHCVAVVGVRLHTRWRRRVVVVVSLMAGLGHRRHCVAVVGVRLRHHHHGMRAVTCRRPLMANALALSSLSRWHACSCARVGIVVLLLALAHRRQCVVVAGVAVVCTQLHTRCRG